jgi:hypothetical protein
VRLNEPPQPLPHVQTGYKSQIKERVRSASSCTTGGAPVVQATSPGAEFRDALQRRAVRAQLLQQPKASLSSGDSVLPALVKNDSTHYTDAGSAKPKRPLAARRFHLSRSNLTLASSKHSGGIQKHKNHNKSRLATFVERHVEWLNDGEPEFSNKSFAIDRLIDDADLSPQAGSVQHNSSIDRSTNSASAMMGYSPKRIQSFVKAPAELAKTGNSIKDHPSTWNHDSDQLASELAAFALEISEEDKAGKRDQKQMETKEPQTPELSDTDMDVDDIFVYETYLRVPRSELSPHHEGKISSIGMLVIEEKDEELWQTFAEDEEDSEWDEEDGDSNGTCISQLRFDI